MRDFSGGFIVGYAICAVFSVFSIFFWTNTNSYEMGVEVQKVIDVCEEKLPRNEKCTFLIVHNRPAPGSSMIYDEEEKE